MKIKKMIYSGLVTAFLLLQISAAYAADESVLFSNVAPNALIVLDLSGSMNWTAYGDTLYSSTTQTNCTDTSVAYYPTSSSSHNDACTAQTTGTMPIYGDSTCLGPFYTSPTGRTDCSRAAIAKAAIFKLLDNDHRSSSLNTILSTGTATDDGKLNVQMGFFRFYNASGEDANTTWTTGNEKLIAGFGTKYSGIYCGSSSSCVQTTTGSGSVNDTMSPVATGGTPLAHSISKVKAYIESYNANTDNAKSCRQNFVILITDGADTYACPNWPTSGCGTQGCGKGGEYPVSDYPRRKMSVKNAYALANATLASGNTSKVKIFVIGFGTSLPTEQQNTLNWMAYFGGTSNTSVSQSGSTTAVSISANPCSEGSTNDPGNSSLTGYAFFAQTPAALSSALTQAINLIKAGTYSFSTTSIATSRITSENNLFEASFEPIDDEPFWKGHLKKFSICGVTGGCSCGGTACLWGAAGVTVPSGSIATSSDWDTGTRLQTQTSSSRSMYTLSGGGLASFSTSLSPVKFGLISTNTDGRDAAVGYFRGDSTYNLDNWKLGDIFHTNPITISSPNANFVDANDLNNAFTTFRNNHPRASGSGRVVLIGANDGQIRTIAADTGYEQFSFIAPNLLPKLPEVSHSSHPTALVHQYFVDGPMSVSDIWLGTGDYTHKSASDWHTFMIFGLGRGAEDQNSGYTSGYLWSKSASCDCTTSATAGDCGFSPTYSATYPYYCGYYALDFTDTANPAFRWILQPSAALAPYLAGPWSKMAIGKVLINGSEKWVGFIGGGGFSYSCQAGVYTAPTPENSPGALPTTAGRGFFVVDLSNGNILWSYTSASNSNMSSMPAPPSAVDTDNDGFIDTAYVGDLAGNVWRFKFCKKGQTSCNTGNWTGSLFFQHDSNIRPIYTAPTVSRDTAGNIWVYWGTGDKQCPAILNSTDRFYALIDDGSTSYTVSNLKSTNSATYSPTTDTTYKGWYYQLAASEKMLADPIVFLGVTLFTTFTPYSGSDMCQTGGTATLYGLNYVSAGGAFTGGTKSVSLGVGLPQAPLISMNPNTNTADLYVTVGGALGNSRASFTKKVSPPFSYPPNRANTMYWKDLRLQ